ncbi:hypothetical protein GCM10020254_40620 [Streptomyces goshikiensis]
MGGFAIHRLGMALCLAVAALCAGSAVAARVRERTVRRRIGSLLAAAPVRRGPVVGGADTGHGAGLGLAGRGAAGGLGAGRRCGGGC